MSVVAIALSVLLLGVLFLIWVNYRQAQLRLTDLESSVDVFVHRTIEQQVTLENLLEATTTSVEDVHKAFTDVSFDILDAIPQTREASKHLRDFHDKSASGVYGSMRAVGKGLGLVRAEVSARRRQKEQKDNGDN